MPDEFDNSTFWEHRYQTDPERGSGGGSRGTFLTYKHDLLQKLIADHEPASILDVGCGDIEVTRNLEFSGRYTGIDLSPTVIARNRQIRPDWQFRVGDFLELLGVDRMRADLIICFDVLIHQHEIEVYRAFVSGLVEAADRMAILTGFEGLPRRGRLSPNVAFHEPLSTTLGTIAGIDVFVLEPFRNMHVVQVGRHRERDR